jgi:hypothetical protein
MALGLVPLRAGHHDAAADVNPALDAILTRTA